MLDKTLVVIVRVRSVSVCAGDGEPERSEEQPTEHEGGSEDKDDVAPAQLDDGGEDVDEIAAMAAGDVLRRHPAVAVLLRETRGPAPMTAEVAIREFVVGF